jgi:hypothetical protein
MRYFLAFLVMLVLILSLFFLLFHGSSKPKIPLTTRTLSSYAPTDAEAIMTIDGPINADQNHQAIRITVSRDDVMFEQIQGYQNSVVNLQNFANNQNAYVNFLLALAHAGFTKGNADPSVSDERGFCALGDRYVFELRQDNKDLERYWATSCGNPKTYKGVLNLTLLLFQAQVPQYTDLTRNARL